ncbi:hypothetical protein [Achromobacter dolens]|uniref:hypothetical protein n=1 Tax=Achromobacter dolens TaxID=1287738 RepID=UPI003B9D9ED9
MELIDNTTAPRVFTPARIEQMAAANAAARSLRSLGLRVIDEDLFPKDQGAPILLVDLGAMPAEYLRGLCDVSTRQADGHITAQFQGVRLAIQQNEVRHDG